MRRWLKSRTPSIDVWRDKPRIEPPGDEVQETSKMLKLLSKNEAGRFEFGLIVSMPAIDRICLTIGLEREELFKSLRDEAFVREVFGEFSSIADFLSGGWMRKRLSKNERGKSKGNVVTQKEQFEETKILLDQLGRWEKNHESTRGL
jgi:hypothetical protein